MMIGLFCSVARGRGGYRMLTCDFDGEEGGSSLARAATFARLAAVPGRQ